MHSAENSLIASLKAKHDLYDSSISLLGTARENMSTRKGCVYMNIQSVKWKNPNIHKMADDVSIRQYLFIQ